MQIEDVTTERPLLDGLQQLRCPHGFSVNTGYSGSVYFITYGATVPCVWTEDTLSHLV